MKPVLVDLDALLDTRLGILTQHFPGATDAIINGVDYWHRDFDDWDKLTQGATDRERFAAAYQQRDIETLKCSMMTGIFIPLLRIFKEHKDLHDIGAVGDELGVEVNLSPYQLDDGLKAVIAEALETNLYPDLPVTFVSLDQEALTPEYIDDHYAAWFSYDFASWLKRHAFNLKNRPLPGVDVVAPRLFDRNPDKLTLKEKQEDVLYFRLAFTELIKIQFIEAKWFSMFPAPADDREVVENAVPVT